MSETPTVSSADPPGRQVRALPEGWLRRYPWATFVVPLAVFLLVGSLEPRPPRQPAVSGSGPASETTADATDDAIADVADLDGPEAVQPEAEGPVGGGLLPQLPYRYYPLIYTCKIVLTIVAMLLVWPGYRTFPFRLSALALVVGVVGAGIWIGLCTLDLEQRLLKPLGLGGFLATGERSAFNPLEQMGDAPALAYAFLAIRLFGLVVIVPVIEEFFLRGFLMRFVMHDSWQEIPFGDVNRLAVVVGTAVPMLMHPAELLAAMAWFSMVTWLMVRTRNIWDCVLAHAVTNLLLGVYVLASGNWSLM